MYLRGTAYTVAISMPIAIAGLILTEPLIRTWLGERLTPATTPSRLFLLYLTFVVFHMVGTTMVVALGRVRFVLVVATANLVVNFAISVALVGPFGVKGVVLGTLIAEALAWPPLLWFFLREFNVRLGEWIQRTVVPNLPGLAAQGATAPAIFYLGERATNLAEVAALGLLSTALSLCAFVWLGLSGPDRRLLFATLASALGGHPAEAPAPGSKP
jgi:O-antigen/teichoic acid export membrane protein